MLIATLSVHTGTMWKSSKDRRAAAKDAKHIMECKLAAAFARVAELELALSSLTSDPELLARLLTIGPCLVAQKQAAAAGTIDTHSSRALVTKEQHIAANAAKHIFGVDFRKLSMADIRRIQRGGKTPLPTNQPTQLLLPDPPPYLPPPAPPPLPGLLSAIACADLEAFRFSLYGHTSIGAPECLWVGSGQFCIDESSMVFTLGAEDFVTEPNENDGSAPLPVTVPIENDGCAPFPVNYVTEANDKDKDSTVTDTNDMDQGNKVTDTNVKENEPVMDDGNCVGSAPLPERLVTVTDIIDNDEAGVTDLIDDRAVGFPDNNDNCNETKPKDKQEGAEGPLMFSEAFSHEAICLFLKTGSTEHILRKYKSLLNVTVHIDSVCHAPASKVFIYKMLYNSQRRVVVSILKSIQLPFSDVDSQVDLVDRLFQFMAGLTTGSKEWETLPIFMRPVAMGSTIACRRKCADAYASIRNFFKTDPCNHKMKKYTFRCKDAGGMPVAIA